MTTKEMKDIILEALKKSAQEGVASPVKITLSIEKIENSRAMHAEQENLLQIEQKGILLTPEQYEEVWGLLMELELYLSKS